MLAMPSKPSSVLGLLSLASMAAAHMELIYPLPFNSKYDKSVTNPDYSMTSPLSSDGSNFPCKGYQSMFDSTSPKAELVAGSNFNFTLTGSARHNGGSCELSVSYDQAKTFAVIHRISGGCPLEDTYAFQVPSDLPGSDKAIFAWTWFNEIGNREMYMNCAAVSIQGSSTSYTAPEIFKANVFSDGTCRTPEGTDVQFPPVGAVSTDYKGSNTASTPATQLDNCAYDEGQLVTVTSSGNSSPASGSNSSTGSGSSGNTASNANSNTVVAGSSSLGAQVPPAAGTSASVPAGGATSAQGGAGSAPTTQNSVPAATSQAVPTTVASQKTTFKPAATTKVTSSAPAAQTTSAGSGSSASTGTCTSGEIICDSESTWSLCSNGQAIFMGSVAGGMACKNGAMVLASAASSPGCTDGTITCSSDGQSWSQCSNGQLINMGSVAAGTTCSNGSIVASSTRKRMVRHVKSKSKTKSKNH